MGMRCKQGSCSSNCSWRGSPYALPTTGDSRTRQPAVMPLQTGLLHAERCTSGSCFHCEPARQLILYLASKFWCLWPRARFCRPSFCPQCWSAQQTQHTRQCSTAAPGCQATCGEPCASEMHLLQQASRQRAADRAPCITPAAGAQCCALRPRGTPLAPASARCLQPRRLPRPAALGRLQARPEA